MGDIGDMFSYCSRGVMSAQSGLSQKRGGLSSSKMLAMVVGGHKIRVGIT